MSKIYLQNDADRQSLDSIRQFFLKHNDESMLEQFDRVFSVACQGAFVRGVDLGIESAFRVYREYEK